MRGAGRHGSAQDRHQRRGGHGTRRSRRSGVRRRQRERPGRGAARRPAPRAGQRRPDHPRELRGPPGLLRRPRARPGRGLRLGRRSDRRVRRRLRRLRGERTHFVRRAPLVGQDVAVGEQRVRHQRPGGRRRRVRRGEGGGQPAAAAARRRAGGLRRLRRPAHGAVLDPDRRRAGQRLARRPGRRAGPRRRSRGRRRHVERRAGVHDHDGRPGRPDLAEHRRGHHRERACVGRAAPWRRGPGGRPEGVARARLHLPRQQARRDHLADAQPCAGPRHDPGRLAAHGRRRPGCRLRRRRGARRRGPPPRHHHRAGLRPGRAGRPHLHRGGDRLRHVVLLDRPVLPRRHVRDVGVGRLLGLPGRDRPDARRHHADLRLRPRRDGRDVRRLRRGRGHHRRPVVDGRGRWIAPGGGRPEQRDRRPQLGHHPARGGLEAPGGRPRRRPGRGRGDQVRAVVRRPGDRGDVPPDRPALRDRPVRPGRPAAARRAEDPRLLGVPPPPRRAPAARHGPGRDDRRHDARGAGGSLRRHRPHGPAPDRRGEVREGHRGRGRC